MTILAGAFSRTPGATVPRALCDALTRVISRSPDDQRTVFQDQRVCLVKVDVRAHTAPAFHADRGSGVSLLAGEPLLTVGDVDRALSRQGDLERLHEEWTRGTWQLLRQARGVFCGVHYDPRVRRLTLIADKLGIRQLYYWLSDELCVFATALRVLEQLPGWPKIMDVRSVTEMVSLGFPLGTRTPYAGVALLRAAEIVTITEGEVARQQYWRWDAVEPSARSEHELPHAVHDRFAAAVACRLRADSATIAFLSGGLDSRCIVAFLRDRRVRTHTFNFGAEGIQDRAFAAAFAREAGTIHEERPLPSVAKLHWSMLMASALSESTHLAASPVERPRLVWSGDGGSVGLGHVYLSRPIVDLLRAGRRDAAIEQYLQERQATVVRRLLRPEIGHAMAGALQTGIREELDDVHCDDPGRSFHVFLMLNDQRRHLAAHFEDIDLHRLEFHLPFFDSDLLELIVGSPLDICLGHGLYMRFLARAPSTAMSVPWQSYPGHAPCPLPTSQTPVAQWSKRIQPRVRAMIRRDLLGDADALLRRESFPEPLLQRRYLQAARWMYGLKLWNYGYVLESARVYHRYWSLCDGKYELDPHTSLTRVA